MEIPHFEVTHYIDGEFVGNGTTFEKLYPATNQPIATVSEGKQAEVDAAVDAASEAFKTWGKMSAKERQPILKAFAAGIRAHGRELAKIETYDVGRPIRENSAAYLDRTANKH